MERGHVPHVLSMFSDEVSERTLGGVDVVKQKDPVETEDLAALTELRSSVPAGKKLKAHLSP